MTDKPAPVTIHPMRAVTAPGYPPCTEFYVYRGDTLVRVCPSIGMAREVTAGFTMSENARRHGFA